ncbi:MAG: hypothetical protein HS127_14360 [Planctomycetia bacterium]|nr:hypothetical protein [Planctomycetia bacterium]
MGVALRVFEELAINDTDLLALSKDRGKSGIPKGEQGNKSTPHIPHPILLPSSSPSSYSLPKFVMRRTGLPLPITEKFVTKSITNRPSMKSQASALSEKALIKRFGSIEGIETPQ